MQDRSSTAWRKQSRLACLAGVTLFILSLGSQSVSVLAQGGARETKTTPPDAVARPETKVTTHTRVKPRVSKKPLRQTPTNTVSLWIVSNPPGSKVTINGEARGETDAQGELQVNLAPATYTVRVTREGYVTSEGDVEINPTLGAQQEVNFDLAPAVVSLNIVTDPAGAEVYLDDVYKGTSNSNGLLVLDHLNPSQSHKLRITKAGYAQQSEIPITTYGGQISIKLLPESVRVRVTTDPPESEIYFDDVYKGSSTSDGALVIDSVNPNQSHKLRGKKVGYIDQIRLLSPNSTEISLKLLPDPVVLLVKEIRQQIADANLVKGFNGYDRLLQYAPDQPELPRLLESLLQGLQTRSTDTLKRIEPFGLAIDGPELVEMKSLYDKARKWHPGDESIETFGKYCDMKFAFFKLENGSSAAENENLKRDAQVILTDLSQRNLRNMYFQMEFGWAWLKLNDANNAQKFFTSAQELKPDWAYPYFANALLAIQAGDRESDKKTKLVKYGQAIDGFTKALNFKHDFSRAYALRAIAYAYIKNYPAAADSGLQAVTIDPKSAYAHFALGFAYFQKGGKAAYRSAKDEFERALALDGTELDSGTKNSIQERLAKISKSIK